jgi:hypothetical protein
MYKAPKRTNANIPVNLSAVEQFLDVQANPKKYTDFDTAQIAKKLMAALKEAYADYHNGETKPELTVCVGRLGYANPADVQKYLDGKIPALSLYKRKKDTRHMGVYYKHSPAFYASNKPKVRPDARNRPPRAQKPAKKA